MISAGHPCSGVLHTCSHYLPVVETLLLAFAGITWEAPAAQPLPVTVYDTLPWLWPRSETSQANTPPGLNDE